MASTYLSPSIFLKKGLTQVVPLPLQAPGIANLQELLIIGTKHPPFSEMMILFFFFFGCVHIPSKRKANYSNFLIKFHVHHTLSSWNHHLVSFGDLPFRQFFTYLSLSSGRCCKYNINHQKI